MTDAALENAKMRRKEIQAAMVKVTAEVNRLLDDHRAMKADLDRVEAFITQWHEMAGLQVPAYLAQKKRGATPVQGAARVRPRNPDKEEVARRCVHYIRRAGRPLMRKELMEKLKRIGSTLGAPARWTSRPASRTLRRTSNRQEGLYQKPTTRAST